MTWRRRAGERLAGAGRDAAALPVLQGAVVAAYAGGWRRDVAFGGMNKQRSRRESCRGYSYRGTL